MVIIGNEDTKKTFDPLQCASIIKLPWKIKFTDNF